MEKYNKKICFVLTTILLIIFGFIFGSIGSNKINKTTSNKNSLIDNSSVQNSIISLFFSELENNMRNYNKGTPITIQPISFKNKVAILQYANSQESYAYLVIDFSKNKIHYTQFQNAIAYWYTPIFIVNEKYLIATKIQEPNSNDIEIILTDFEGNVVKTLKKFTKSIDNDFYYEYSQDDTFITITILGKTYTLNPNNDLIEVK